jgi:hypothetical protein
LIQGDINHLTSNKIEETIVSQQEEPSMGSLCYHFLHWEKEMLLSLFSPLIPLLTNFTVTFTKPLCLACLSSSLAGGKNQGNFQDNFFSQHTW